MRREIKRRNRKKLDTEGWIRKKMGRGRKINGRKVRKIETKEERRIDTRNCGNKNV